MGYEFPIFVSRPAKQRLRRLNFKVFFICFIVVQTARCKVTDKHLVDVTLTDNTIEQQTSTRVLAFGVCVYLSASKLNCWGLEDNKSQFISCRRTL